MHRREVRRVLEKIGVLSLLALSTAGLRVAAAPLGGLPFTVSATTVATGDVVVFDALAADGASATVVYAWDFDGDGAMDAYTTSPTIEHAYAQDGSFVVGLTTVNARGDVTVEPERVAIRVTNRAPTAALEVPEGLLRAQAPIEFSAEGSLDGDGALVAWFWDFGDGTTSHEQTPSHTYETFGTYAVRLTVADDDGATASAETGPLIVEGSAPVAAFRVEGPAESGLAVWFYDATTVADLDIAQVGWDFGDGVYWSGGPSSDGTYAHAYATSGSYAVTLYIIDRFGTMSIVCQIVVVRE